MESRSFMRRLAILSVVVFLVGYVISLMTTGVPWVAPLSLVVVVLLAWEFGFKAGLAWVAIVHVGFPLAALLGGYGPFYVFSKGHGIMALIMVATALVAAALAFLSSRVRSLTRQLRMSEAALIETNDKLQSALDEVKELRGYLPICAWCKSIRDVSGNWEKLESYIARHSRATFTHGLCPKCHDEQLRTLAGS